MISKSRIGYYIVLFSLFFIICQQSLADSIADNSTNISFEGNSSPVIILIPNEFFNLTNTSAYPLNFSNNSFIFLNSGLSIRDFLSLFNISILVNNQTPVIELYNTSLLMNDSQSTRIFSNLSYNISPEDDIIGTNSTNITGPLINITTMVERNSSESPGNLTIQNDYQDIANFSTASGSFINVTISAPTLTSTSIPLLPGSGNVNPVWAVFRSSEYKNWLIFTNSKEYPDIIDTFGRNEDLPVVGDFNGDGIVDRAHFRPREGKWYFDYSFDGKVDKTDNFGLYGEKPVAADFQGDGKTERAMWNENSGKWRIDENMDGKEEVIVTFGVKGDIPLAGDVNHDGICDLIVFRPTDHLYFYDLGMDGIIDRTEKFGSGGDYPFTGDFNRDGLLDRGILRSQNYDSWLIDFGFDGTIDTTYKLGKSGDVPFGWGVQMPDYQT